MRLRAISLTVAGAAIVAALVFATAALLNHAKAMDAARAAAARQREAEAEAKEEALRIEHSRKLAAAKAEWEPESRFALDAIRRSAWPEVQASYRRLETIASPFPEMAKEHEAALVGEAVALAEQDQSDEALSVLRKITTIKWLEFDQSLTPKFDALASQLKVEEEERMEAARMRAERARVEAEQREAEQEAAKSRGSKPDDMEVETALKKYARENFNDDDVDFIDIYRPEASGAYWVVIAKVRARNAFGAKITKMVSFHMQGDSVVFMRE